MPADGLARIDWAERQMPVLRSVRERFAAEQPLGGVRVGACLHVTAETAALVRALRAGGAGVALCAANPLSTQDDVADALRADGVEVHAVRGHDVAAYRRGIEQGATAGGALPVDDGGGPIAPAPGKAQGLRGGPKADTRPPRPPGGAAPRP